MKYCVGITMETDWGETDSRRIDRALVRRVLSYFRPYWPAGLLALACLAAGALLGLDAERFDRDRTADPALERILRDVEGAVATGQVRGTPTLFIDGVVHRGDYDAATLIEVLAA